MVEKQLKTGQASSSEDIDCSESGALEGEVAALVQASDDNLPSTTLLQILQAFLALEGRAFSIGALRDLGDPTEAEFSPRSAVDALGQIGYKSSLGQMKPSRVKSTHCPLIAFTKTGEAVLVERDGELSNFKVTSFCPVLKQTYLNSRELNLYIENFVILAKKNQLTELKTGSWFWGSFAQSKWLYVQVILAAMLNNVFALSAGLFIMVIYDRVVPNQATESLIVLAAGAVIVLAIDFVIKTIKGQFIDRAGQRADGRMARLIFNRLLSLKLDDQKQKSGAMASVVREFDTLKEFFASATLVAVVDLPFIFFFIWVVSLISGPLAFVPLTVVTVVLLVSILVQPVLAMTSKKSLETTMSKQSVLIETLNGIETIRATGSGRLMRKRFEDATNVSAELMVKNRVVGNIAINIAASALQYNMIATIFFGVFMMQEGLVTMGTLMASVIIGGRSLGPLSQIATALTRAHSARQAYRSLSKLMEESDQDDSAAAKLSRPYFDGVIEVQKLSYKFSESTSPIINDLSLKIPKGQKVAIVGKMGSGKSTLARLLSGIVSPTGGAVLLDGIDIRQVDPSDLRRNVGVMLQETWLFSGTVRENIQMGFFEQSDQHLLKACEIAGVDDFISKHPSGYDLELKERGEGLSGGQKQSINLARALLQNPNVIILDEPTSSMDQATEASIISGLKSWSADKTMIMITHRNSLLQLADRVIVMDDGQILQDTTVEKLKAQQMARG